MDGPTDVEFLRAFEARRDCCRALLTLARKQQESIAAEDYTRLLALLAQKQRVLGALDALGRERPTLRDDWRRLRDGAPAAARGACERVLEESESLLAEVLAEERSSTDDLTRRRDETQRRLQELSAGTRAHEAYRDALGPDSHRHLDIGR